MRGVRLIWPDGVVPALRPDDPGVPGLVLGVLGVLGMYGVAGAEATSLTSGWLASPLVLVELGSSMDIAGSSEILRAG